MSDAEFRRRTFPPQLTKYLIKGEDPSRAVALQRHWLTIAEPVGTAVLGLVVLLVVAIKMINERSPLTEVMMWIEVAAIGRAAYYVYKRRQEWWIVTNQRLISLSGIFRRNVAFMPVKKLNDMTLSRGIFGQIFGYGDFIIDQAHAGKNPLGKLDMIEHFDHYYQYIFGEFLVDSGKGDVKKPVPASALPTPPHGAFNVHDLPLVQEDDPTASYATPRDKGVLGRLRGTRDDVPTQRIYHAGSTHGVPYDAVHAPASTTRLGRIRDALLSNPLRGSADGYGPHVVASGAKSTSHPERGIKQRPVGHRGAFVENPDHPFLDPRPGKGETLYNSDDPKRR